MKQISLFNPKVSLHVKLSKGALGELRVILFRKSISVQHFLSYVVDLAMRGDRRILEIIDEAVVYKEANEVNRLNLKDADSLYEYIEEQSPFQHSSLALKEKEQK
jgi:hypothetical protein